MARSRESRTQPAARGLRAKREKLLVKLSSQRKAFKRMEVALAEQMERIQETLSALEDNKLRLLKMNPLNQEDIRVLKGVKKEGNTAYALKPAVRIQWMAKAGYVRCQWGDHGVWFTLTKKGETKIKTGR